jgi:lipoprotein-anchoring transpeptidase ErfK/SrfK
VHGNRQASSGDQQKPAGLLPPFHGDSRPGPIRSGAQRSAWFAAILTAGFSLPAEAQVYDWPMDPGPSYVVEPPHMTERPRPRIVRSRQKLPDAPKDTAKPVGPVLIAISIDKQQLKLYDQNGLFAETPVSTGMRGHSTPMGVFSVIQKNKYHRSNIYSNAPMPYMQRITWSGVAMHAGVLPGYPASHGCIRMPMNFAMRMWGWTRMGARVIITPGEVSPADFSHPLLVARKPESKPVAAASETQHAATTPKSDRSSIVDAAFGKTDLRLTSIHDKPVRTADASGAIPQKHDTGITVAQASEAPKDTVQNIDAPKATVGDDTAKKDTATESIVAGDAKPAEAKPDSEKAADAKSGAEKDAAPAGDKDQARATDPVVPVSVTPPLEGAAEFIGPVKPRSGHIAAFISRKNSTLYVRQNFEPWFETPVTIAPSDRPLGTHVFTARADKDDANAFRWSVVSLPASVRAARLDDDTPRRKRAADAAIPAPPSSPAEALDRLNVPDDAMKRIASAMASGSSLVVSDLGLGDETGRGTDFIVPLR